MILWRRCGAQRGTADSRARAVTPCALKLIDVNQRELRGMGGHAALHIACASGAVDAARLLVQVRLP